MGKRGSATSVPESWLEECRRWRKDEGLTAKATGAHLARAVRRSKPFAVATIHRYLSGTLVTAELTAAFAKAMGVPGPAQIDNERHQRWYELGVRLDNRHAELFSAEMERLEQLVSILDGVKQVQECKD